MNNTKRSERLQANVREDLLDTIKDLNSERKQAKKNDNPDLAMQYLDKIEDILDKLNEMSEVALQQLNDSKEVTEALKKLGEIAENLEKIAGEMKNAQEKLTKATELISQATQFVTGLAGLGLL